MPSGRVAGSIITPQSQIQVLSARAGGPSHRPTSGNSEAAEVFLYTRYGFKIFSSSRTSETWKVKIAGFGAIMNGRYAAGTSSVRTCELPYRERPEGTDTEE